MRSILISPFLFNMIGIYKITNPKGRVYVGQSINIKERWKNYSKLRDCKNQIKLYRSLVKYSFSEHIFEIVQECSVEELNIIERHWQDFYNVIGPNGLNCKLTGTEDKSGFLSQETRQKQSKSHMLRNRTEEGKLIIQKRIDNTDYNKRTDNTDYKKKVLNTDFEKRTANTDYNKRTLNFDYKKKVNNTNYSEIGKKHMKVVLQFAKDGIFIREWPSIKEAGETLKIQRADISGCCRGINKTSGGFIWKYK
jgi:group I intron endonuclease